MPKPQKVEAVTELSKQLKDSQAALLTSFRGLKVAEMTELRRSLSASNTQFMVVKNTLARIAARQAGLEDLVPLFEGSTAIAFVHGDPVAAAKGLDDVAKKYPALEVKGGLMEGRVLTAERAKALATIQSREILLSMLAGAIKQPASLVLNLVSAPLRSMGYAFAAYRDSLAEGSPAPAEPEAAETAPADAPAADAPAADA